MNLGPKGRNSQATVSAAAVKATSYQRNAVVLGIASGVVAITFGVLATTTGLSMAKSMVMSLLVFTGASQFAALSVIVSGGSPISAVASAMLLGARNGLYGLRLSEQLARFGWRRIPMAQLVIDEATVLAVAQPDEETSNRALLWGGGSVFVFWNAGTFVGVRLGEVLGDPDVYGLDVAFPASFVALLVPLLRQAPERAAALLAAAIAVVAIPFTPAGAPILLAALAVGPAVLLTGAGGGEPDQQSEEVL